MKSVFKLFLITAVLVLTACGSITTTKTTEYDASGNIVKITETSSDSSDFAAYMASGEGNATYLYGDVSKFNFGWNGYGFNWLSISGGRTKAPVKADGADSAAVLEKMANVIKANKTSVEAGEVSVNSGSAK